ncbi:hypothetical protein ARMGADRAFT_1087640 [Armillaria gallica]|uniref:Uncharacterized protein n=1 Tax=Armillaria gallica TaxID=47427 RepID=A0A2H3CQ58_ARMGA|nr:hypothetical protein ARMGADRAFT_1087640 [Armillaria gallica]
MGKRQRLKKEEHKNQKGWAEGVHAEILDRHVLGFVDALERGYQAKEEYFGDVSREYFFLVLWRLEDRKEPPRPLPLFDKTIVYMPQELTPGETEEKRVKVDSTVKRMTQYLRCRARKLQKKHLHMRRDIINDPYTIFLAQLAGITRPLKSWQAYQEWMVHHSTEVAKKTDEVWEAALRNGETRKPGAGVRMGAARSLFSELTQDGQDIWKAKAKEMAERNKHKYQNALKALPLKSPRERQLCILGLPAFLAPILKGIHDQTGLNVVMLVGGPMPCDGGEIGTMNLVYRKNQEPTPVSWPQWKKQEFDKILLHYCDFLNMVYSNEDRKTATLLEDDMNDPSLWEDGLFLLDDKLKGLTEDLDDVSDSLDDDSSDDKVENAGRKKRPRKGRSTAGVNAPGGNAEHDNGDGKVKLVVKEPQLSAYRIERLKNIECIQNDPRMKQLNKEIRHIREENTSPHPKPKLRKQVVDVPLRQSGRLNGEGKDTGEIGGGKEWMVLNDITNRFALGSPGSSVSSTGTDTVDPIDTVPHPPPLFPLFLLPGINSSNDIAMDIIDTPSASDCVPSTFVHDKFAMDIDAPLQSP